jgi:hypothetical protein
MAKRVQLPPDSDVRAVMDRLGGLEKFASFGRGVGRVMFGTNLILSHEVEILAQPPVVTSAKYFEDAGVTWMGCLFRSEFLGIDVPATKAINLTVRKLKQNSSDAYIVSELGGEKAVEITASHLREFLSQNRESNEIFLFYLRGRKGTLWAVDANWNNGGWRIGANSNTVVPVRRLAEECVVTRQLAI